MKEKKLEWAKPVLEYLGTAATNGEGIAGICSTCSSGSGNIGNCSPNCEGGQAAPAKCHAGAGGPV